MISTTTNRNCFAGRVTRRQLEILVDAIEKNPDLNRLITPNYTNDQRNKDWAVLAAKLNKNGGALKSVGKWKKCWLDYKTEVRKRYLGKLNCKRSLSSLEERTAIFMGLDLTKSAATVPDKTPLELEISQVESIKGMPTASGEQEIVDYLAANAESMNVITLVPDESRPVTIIRVKIDPEDGDSGHGKTVTVNNTPPTDAPTFLPVTSSATADTPVTRFISVLKKSLVPESTPVPKEPHANESSPISKKTSVTQFKPVSEESVSESPVIDETSCPEFTFAPEELSALEFPPVNTKKRKKQTKRKKESCTKDLVKVQTATAEALQMVGRALETMAENQKSQLAIEERRTVLFEKLINHFCK